MEYIQTISWFDNAMENIIRADMRGRRTTKFARRFCKSQWLANNRCSINGNKVSLAEYTRIITGLAVMPNLLDTTEINVLYKD